VSAERDQRALEYIRECIDLIEWDVRSDSKAFTDIKRSAARSIMWSLMTLADETTKLSDELQDRNSKVPWKKIRGFRNFAAHAYEHIRMEVVCAIVQEDLPPLKTVVETELAALRRDS